MFNCLGVTLIVTGTIRYGYDSFPLTTVACLIPLSPHDSTSYVSLSLPRGSMFNSAHAYFVSHPCIHTTFEHSMHFHYRFTAFHTRGV